MKIRWLGLVFLGVSSAWAQSDALQGLPSVSQERARIEASRRQQTAELDAQERACQSRFAVVDCVNAVSARRRAMLAEFKRQEASLHDAERRQRGAEQLKLSEEKAQEQAQSLSEKAAEPAGNSEDDRLQAQREKQAQHAKRPTSASSAPQAEKTAGLDAATAAQNRADYARKQEAAAQRLRDREKRLKEANKTVTPLPTAP